MEGAEKRRGLEEAKPPLPARTAFPPIVEEGAPHNPSMLSNVSYLRESLEGRAAADNRMLLAPSAGVVFDRQLVSSFWERYVPVDYVVQGGSPSIWLEQIIAQPDPGECVLLSLKALAMTRLGWLNNDASMATQGHIVYGRALQSVQHSLWRENMAMHDDVFMAGYVFALFESTTTSIAGWNSHISGLSQLVLARGPHRHQSPLTRATLEEFRTSAMIQCIQYRKSSFLGTEEWRAIPWETTPKDIFQQLYDKGFALGALLENIDNADLISPNASISELSAFLQRLIDMNVEMEQWYQELLSQSPSPLSWSTDLPQNIMTTPSTTDQPDVVEPSSMTPFAFPNLRLACILVTYWGLRVILSNTIAITCGAILSADSPVLRAESSSSRDLRGMAQQLLGEHGDRIRLEYATNIMRSMPYSLSDSMGFIGAQKCLFGLRTALFSLRRHPGEDLKWCKAVYQQLDTKKGLRYAREIAKLDGRLSASGRDSLPMRISETRASSFEDESSAEEASSSQSFFRSMRPVGVEAQPSDVDPGFLTDTYRQKSDRSLSPSSQLQGVLPHED